MSGYRHSGLTQEEYERRQTLREAAGALSESERTFLDFALDQAAEEMLLGDGFTPDDWAALATFRRLIDPEVE